uniref:ISL3-like element ISKox3 family transposase n=1 Tax=Escherichia coli TaxID=562 RepID=A0A2S1PQR8_ECOLX|nr:ISL3-like element ISKox3 family transposase [Escherichia coli]
MACSRYPLPALSAPSTGSSASSVHAATSAFPAGIRSSTYRCTATGSGFLLPGVGFQQGGADVHSDGFYQLPRPVASPHGSGQRRFSQPHWVRAELLLHSVIAGATMQWAVDPDGELADHVLAQIAAILCLMFPEHDDFQLLQAHA